MNNTDSYLSKLIFNIIQIKHPMIDKQSLNTHCALITCIEDYKGLRLF